MITAVLITCIDLKCVECEIEIAKLIDTQEEISQKLNDFLRIFLCILRNLSYVLRNFLSFSELCNLYSQSLIDLIC